MKPRPRIRARRRARGDGRHDGARCEEAEAQTESKRAHRKVPAPDPSKARLSCSGKATQGVDPSPRELTERIGALVQEFRPREEARLRARAVVGAVVDR